ncbi:hypothetical protein Catovirus_1_958 [Catovirus CTV1]|uniref:Uncharacterized protein n=1 Tax=Catovirus CTV1 TaxID=1977631 RepID=A0A1V0SB79_9VIRU|nr:hypothetical protein Catovirus_1_958 [Catovirus CTV1]
MNYVYPPIYKYIVFVIVFFMFLRCYKAIPQDSYLIVSVIAAIIFILLDYILINGHDNIIGIEQNVDYDSDYVIDNLIDTESERFDGDYNDIYQYN